MAGAPTIDRPITHKVARLFYRLLWWLVTPLIPFYLRRRVNRQKEDLQRLSERRGVTNLLRPKGPLVWIHGASVGESLSALALIERLLEERRDLSVLVTTGTVTSAALMDARLPARAFHQFAPIDHPLYVSRFLSHWRPNAVLWFESEFWPNLLVSAQKQRLPMALLNARMSESSFEGWRKHKWAIEPILKGFGLCFAQNDRVRDMLTELGAARAETSGNLKFVAEALPDNTQERETLASAIGGRPLLIASQTIRGEEEILAQFYPDWAATHPGLLIILAPRHPERGPEIEALLQENGLGVARRSGAAKLSPETQIYLADTMGELGLFYRLNGLVFLGRSLVEGGGGSNPLEPARLNCAIVQGPHTDNFEEITNLLSDGGGVEIVPDVETFRATVTNLLGDMQARHTLGTHAAAVADKGQEILDRVSTAVLPLVPQDESFENIDDRWQGGAYAGA